MIPTSIYNEALPIELLTDKTLSTTVVLDLLDSDGSEKPIKLANYFDFDREHFNPGKEAPTLERFIYLINEIIKNVQDREQTVEAERVIFTEEYPLERIDRFGDELITWRVISRIPANLSSDGKSRPQLGFTHSYNLRAPEYPDKVITVETRPVDHKIEFSCWAKRSRLANRRALWLERTLIDNKHILAVQGIDRFIWEERLADTYLNVGGAPLYQRPLRFFVRLAEFRVIANTAISHITFESGAAGEILTEQSLFPVRR